MEKVYATGNVKRIIPTEFNDIFSSAFTAIH
jgi:hypothetical protein